MSVSSRPDAASAAWRSAVDAQKADGPQIVSRNAVGARLIGRPAEHYQHRLLAADWYEAQQQRDLCSVVK